MKPLQLGFVTCLLVACGQAGDVKAPGTSGPDRDGNPATVEPDAGSEPSDGDDAGTSECDDPDGDGYGPGCAQGADCEPSEPHAHPGESERCFDRIDNDCDGVIDEDCDCDPASPDCGVTPPPPPQTLGEFVFELSQGAMELDPMCGGARKAALDPERDAIVANIDGMVTTDDAVTMGEVARNVMRPLLESGELRATSNAATEAVALLVDEAFDPEQKTLAALVQLLGADSALSRDDVFELLSAGLDDARIAELLHAFTTLSERPVLSSTVADTLLRTASGALDADSQTLSCTGLSITSLSDRLLDAARLGSYAAEGGPVLVPDANDPSASIDLSRTGIALGTELVRDALRAGVPRDASQVLDTALGAPESCGDGCVAYGAADHPLADASHVALDLLRYDESRALLEGVATLLREKPEVAESLLVASGQLIERVRAADVQLEPQQVVRLARDLLPLLERIFSAGADTPRLLLRAIHDLGGTARDFPTRLGWTLDYRSLVKSPTCSDNPPDLARSTPVDYASPRASGNRSTLEQTIELLSAVDCGTVPFTGKSVGVFVLDTVAGMSPGTVCGVTDVLLGALDLTGVVGDFFTKIALRTIGCSDADRVLAHLDSLEDLAASGALDFLIPLDKVFADQGQLETLIDIFSIVAADLALDDDANPATRSVFRQLEPVISDLIAEGSADALFDLTDVLVTVQSTDARGRPATLGDVLVDFAAFTITRHDVPTRAGRVQSSHGAELLSPLERLATRLGSDESKAAVSRMLDHASSYLHATPDGRLERAEILPFSRLVLDGLVEVWALPRATRDCYVDGVMADADALWTSDELGALMAVARAYREGPEHTLIEQVGVDFLSLPVQGARDVRSPLWKVLAGGLQTTLPDASYGDLVPYLSRVLDPDVTHGAAVLNTLDTLVQGDPDQVFLGMLRKSVAVGASGEPVPAGVLMDSYTHALAITGDSCSPEHEPWSARGLDSAVRTLLGFLRDPDTGVPALFDALEEMAFP